MNSLTVIISLIFQSTYGQNSPRDYLNSHNAARNQVGVANVTLDNTIATYAQSYASQQVGDCSLVHSNGRYGVNLAKGTGTFTSTYAVSLWVAEKQYYTYNTNDCASDHDCLHYTQIVWRESIRIGCDKVKCDNGWWYVVCNYDPPGNYERELSH
ncbi:pathogenesis-related protein 1B-like [Rhodamnia argentea]|uniref:Pathogenesis-related protein 1 n=1 Tax=Rhodamnia argentea TaxID=178133 RepID=A0A8B8QVP7_9MYRT|nr:pathogenesis-related protein 1B-like [Rhodamnia argentea]